MADNIIKSGIDYLVDKYDQAKTYVEKQVVAHEINKFKQSIADGFVTHDKLTPELIEQGWKEGLDGQPYNSNLKYTGDDWARDQANAAADARVQSAANTTTGGGGTTTDSSPFQLSQDLRQRTPSGTIYNPDLSAYNDSSLFNYTGPGGVPEYTYGQGLPTDGAGYDIWGTPTDVPNPYYWGQFGEGYVEPEETGIADGAITLPPIDLPDGVSPTNNNPNVGTPDTNIPTNTPTGGNGDKDLNYFETLAAMGIDPSDAPSTTFPGINDKVVQEGIINKDAVKTTLPYQSGINPNLLNSYINEAEGDSDYVNSGINPSLLNSYINEAEGDSDYVNSGINPSLLNSYINEAEGDSDYVNSGMDYAGLDSYINEAQGDSDYVNSGINPSLLDSYINESNVGDALPISSVPKGDFNNLSPIGPSIYDTQYTPVPYQVGGEEQVFDAKYNMQQADDSDFNYGTGYPYNTDNFKDLPYIPPFHPDKGSVPLTDAGRQASGATAENLLNAKMADLYQYGTSNQGYQPRVITQHTQDTLSGGGNKEELTSDMVEPYTGMYIDDSRLPEVNLPDTDTIFAEFNKAAAADDPDAFEWDGINLVTTTDKKYKTNNEITLRDNEIWMNGRPYNTSTGLFRDGSDDDWTHLTDVNLFREPEGYNWKTNSLVGGPAGSPYYGTPPLPVPEKNVASSNDYVPKEQFGLDEAAVAGWDWLTGLFDDPSENTPLEGPAGSTVPSYSGSINTGESQLGKINAALSGTSPGWGNSRIWENPPEPTPYSSGVDPNLLNSYINEGGDAEGQIFYQDLQDEVANAVQSYKDGVPEYWTTNIPVGNALNSNNSLVKSLLSQELEPPRVAPVAEHPGVTAKKNLAWKAEQKAAAQQAYAQAQAALQAEAAAKAQGNIHAQAAAYSPPVNVPSIFKPKPAPVASVYAAPGGPPNRPTANPVSRPVYTWKPDYAAGRW